MLVRVLVVAVLFVLCGPTHSQQIRTPPTPTGPVVKLSFIAVDSKNQSVDGMAKEELRVVENKLEQNILSVEPDERPRDIVIAIDVSGSFSSLLSFGIEAAKLIINNRQPTDDVSIITFVSTNQIDTVQDFTTNSEVLLKNVSMVRTQRVKDGAFTAVIDAVYMAADRLANYRSGQNRRKALILISDGQEWSSKHKFQDLQTLLQEKSVQVFALAPTRDWGTWSIPSLDEEAQDLLKKLVATTGGRLFVSKKPKELGDATEEVVRSLNRSFLVTYRSSNNSGTKGFRKVQVKAIPGSKKKVIAMPGYFFTGETEASNKEP